MTLYMETTKIPAEQTVSQIQELLGRYGASAIMLNYIDGKVSAVAFQVLFNGRPLPFQLPCRWEPIFQTLQRRRKTGRFSEEKKLADVDQAKRVAWRQILRWIEAQLALVETDMVQM